MKQRNTTPRRRVARPALLRARGTAVGRLIAPALGLLLMQLPSACHVDDPIYDPSAHLSLTTDWTERTAGIEVPETYTVSVQDGPSISVSGTSFILPQLFEPGTYQLRVFNTPQHILLSDVSGEAFTASVTTDEAGGEVFTASAASAGDGGKAFKESAASAKDGGKAFKESAASAGDGGKAFKESAASAKDGGKAFKESAASAEDGGKAFKESAASAGDGGKVFKASAVSAGDGGKAFKASAASASSSLRFVQPLPGWLFTSTLSATLTAPATDQSFTARMRQQVRQLTLLIEPSGGTAARIARIEAYLEGVASMLNVDTDVHSAPACVALNFSRQTNGNTTDIPANGPADSSPASKWSATVRLLGTAGPQQRLYAHIYFEDDQPAAITLQDADGNPGSDLTSALSSFNADKKTPLTLTGAIVETPTSAGFVATIRDWNRVTGGSVVAD